LARPGQARVWVGHGVIGRTGSVINLRKKDYNFKTFMLTDYSKTAKTDLSRSRQQNAGLEIKTSVYISLPSNRQHLSCDDHDCLEVRRENDQNCSVLYCEGQFCTYLSTVLKICISV